MDEKTEKQDRFPWQLPFYGAAAALIFFVSFNLFDIDLAELLYLFVATPIVSLVLLVVAFRKKGARRLAVVFMLVAYLAVSCGLVMNWLALRTTTRWILWGKGYKAEVLTQPDSQNGELKHIDWDGWGFAGSDTEVYLVFDPNDSLSTAARSHSPGKFAGIPCKVDRVQRLESHYYSVQFYTDTNWTDCN